MGPLRVALLRSGAPESSLVEAGSPLPPLGRGRFVPGVALVEGRRPSSFAEGEQRGFRVFPGDLFGYGVRVLVGPETVFAPGNAVCAPLLLAVPRFICKHSAAN